MKFDPSVHILFFPVSFVVTWVASGMVVVELMVESVI